MAREEEDDFLNQVPLAPQEITITEIESSDEESAHNNAGQESTTGSNDQPPSLETVGPIQHSNIDDDDNVFEPIQRGDPSSSSSSSSSSSDDSTDNPHRWNPPADRKTKPLTERTQDRPSHDRYRGKYKLK